MESKNIPILLFCLIVTILAFIYLILNPDILPNSTLQTEVIELKEAIKSYESENHALEAEIVELTDKCRMYEIMLKGVGVI